VKEILHTHAHTQTLSDIFLKEYHALSKEYRIKGFCIEIVRNNKVPGTLPIPTSLKRTSHMLKERLASRHGVWQFSCFVFLFDGFQHFFCGKWPKVAKTSRKQPQTSADKTTWSKGTYQRQPPQPQSFENIFFLEVFTIVVGFPQSQWSRLCGMVAVHPFQKEWNPWMNGSCRVMTRCQNHIFSEMAILNVPWTELNRIKSCTLQVRGPLSLVFFESCFLQGCTVCSVSTCFVRQVQHFEDSQGFACDPEKLGSEWQQLKKQQDPNTQIYLQLGCFLGSQVTKSLCVVWNAHVKLSLYSLETQGANHTCLLLFLHWFFSHMTQMTPTYCCVSYPTPMPPWRCGPPFPMYDISYPNSPCPWPLMLRKLYLLFLFRVACPSDGRFPRETWPWSFWPTGT